MFGQPVLVELLWCLIAQCLMRTNLFVDPVPDEQGSLNPVQVGGQVLDLIELVLVGTEGTFCLAITLGLIGSIEVVEKLQFLCGQAKGPKELAATV